jgi:hypothetical protein
MEAFVRRLGVRAQSRKAGFGEERQLGAVQDQASSRPWALSVHH